MSDEKIVIGSVVRLNSGGPKMTVMSRDAGLYYCKWFCGYDLKEGSFSPESLSVSSEGTSDLG